MGRAWKTMGTFFVETLRRIVRLVPERHVVQVRDDVLFAVGMRDRDLLAGICFRALTAERRVRDRARCRFPGRNPSGLFAAPIGRCRKIVAAPGRGSGGGRARHPEGRSGFSARKRMAGTFFEPAPLDVSPRAADFGRKTRPAVVSKRIFRLTPPAPRGNPIPRPPAMLDWRLVP